MPAITNIAIEIVYSVPDKQFIIPLTVDVSCTIRQAIIASNILILCPEIKLDKNKIGIFSKLTPLEQLLKAGDRIEIYRPLIIDPKTARLLRASKKTA